MTTGLIIATVCSLILLIAVGLVMFTELNENVLGFIIFIAFAGVVVGVIMDHEEKGRQPIIYVTESGKFISTDSLKIVEQ